MKLFLFWYARNYEETILFCSNSVDSQAVICVLYHQLVNEEHKVSLFSSFNKEFWGPFHTNFYC
jgi:hypothetical protein